MPLPEWSYEAELLTAYRDDAFWGTVEAGVSLGVVESVQLTADQGWSPRFQASVVVAGIHPHLIAYPGAAYVRIRLRRLPGVPVSLADWTAQWGGTVAAMTGSGATSTAQITAQTGGTPWQSGIPAHAQREQEIDLVLSVRGIVPDMEAGTVALELASCEMDLQELRNLTVAPILDTRDGSGNTSFGYIVPEALRRCGFQNARLVTNDIAAAGAVDFVADVWDIGETAWEYLARVLSQDQDDTYQPLGAELWAESPERWHLTLDKITRQQNATPYIYPEKITPHIEPLRGALYGVQHRIRDSNDDADNTTWRNKQEVYKRGPYGVQRGEYTEAREDFSALPNGYLYERTLGQRDGADLRREGHPFAYAEVLAPADFTIRPDWRYNLNITPNPDYPDVEFVIGYDTERPSRIRQIIWTYPEGQMTVTTENIGAPITNFSFPPIIVP